MAIRNPKVSSTRRSRAIRGVLQREGRGAASHRALSRHSKSAARKRGPASLKAAAHRASRTKGSAVRRRAARKAAQTREARQWRETVYTSE